MAHFENVPLGGSVDLYARVDIPKTPTGDRYSHTDFQGGSRRGYATANASAATATAPGSLTLVDVGLRKQMPPQGQFNPGETKLSSKGQTLRSGHRVQANVPLHIDFNGSIGMVGPTGATSFVVWVVTTIAGITPKISEAVVLEVTAAQDAVQIPLKQLSSKVILSKDVDLTKEVAVKTDLKIANFSAYGAGQHTSVVKNIASTGDSSSHTGGVAGAVTLYFANTSVDYWQPTSARDVSN